MKIEKLASQMEQTDRNQGVDAKRRHISRERRGRETIKMANAKTIVAVLAAVTVVLSGCGTQTERDIERSPEPIDYTAENPKLKDLRIIEDKNETGDYNLASANISGMNLTKQFDKLNYAAFDSKTNFGDELPEGFDPDAIMEKGKEEVQACGVKEAHDLGYTGKGVSVAIIDGTILTEHESYKDQLVYYHETDRISPTSTALMHGTAISSILVGKNGVAPDAKLYYVADDFDVFLSDNSVLAEDINQIIELNKTLPEDDKIRIISISMGGESPETKGYQEYMDAIIAAEKEGIFVLSTTVADGRAELSNTKIQYMGMSKIDGKEGLESYKYAQWVDDHAQETTDWYQSQLCVPMDGFTTASPTGNEDYCFYHNCGLSWATPYLAGAYALACQADPDITFEEFYNIAMDTADSTTNVDKDYEYKFSHIINVEEMVKAVAEQADSEKQ